MKSRQVMCPLNYYQSANGFMVTHALGHMMYGFCDHITCTQVHELPLPDWWIGNS